MLSWTWKSNQGTLHANRTEAYIHGIGDRQTRTCSHDLRMRSRSRISKVMVKFKYK